MTLGQEMVGNQVWARVQPDPAAVEDRVRVEVLPGWVLAQMARLQCRK